MAAQQDLPAPAAATVDDRPATVADMVAMVTPAIEQVSKLLPQLTGGLNQLGQMVQTLLEAHPVCIICVRERETATKAGVRTEYLPGVNLANVIEDGNSVCGNHVGAGQKSKLFVPAAFSR